MQEKKYEEIPIPQELSGRVRAAIVRSEEKRKSQGQKIPVAGIYRRNRIYRRNKIYRRNRIWGYVPVRQQPLCWYLLRR